MSDNCRTPEFPEQVSRSQVLFKRIRFYVARVAIGVLRLRRAQLALTTIVVSLVIMYFPHLAHLRDDLLMLVTAILMVALGSYSMTDALDKAQPDNEYLEDLLEAVADELDVEALDEDLEEVQNAQT